MPEGNVTSPRSSSRRKRSAVRTWLFRLAAVTLFPALFLVALDLLLLVIGFGHPTSFFLPSQIVGEDVYIENIDFGRTYFPSGVERSPLPVAFPIKKPANEYRIFVANQ